MFKDEDGRRYGDWTHRSQRTRESANKIATEKSTDKKWYEQGFWIIFFLIMLWPLGLYLLWKSDWNMAVKGILTVAVIILIYLAMQMYAVVNGL